MTSIQANQQRTVAPTLDSIADEVSELKKRYERREFWWKVLTGIAIVGSFLINQRQIHTRDKREKARVIYEQAQAEIAKVEADYSALWSATNAAAAARGQTPLRDTALRMCRRPYGDSSVITACNLWTSELLAAEQREPNGAIISGARDKLVTVLSPALEEACRNALNKRKDDALREYTSKY